MAPGATRVVLIDDHEMVAESISLALGSAGIEVAAHAATIEAGVRRVIEHAPDVVLLDFRLPDGDGIDGLRAIRGAREDTNVLVLTAVADPRTASRVMEEGATGYLTKDLTVDELVDAVLAASSGRTVIAPDLLGPMLDQLRAPLTEPGATLSPREREALTLLGDGNNVDEIAATLRISRNTARKHVQAVLTKLGAHTQLEAVAIARREGLLGTR
jgi:DNA-binding NarL/FixJ family response regulator